MQLARIAKPTSPVGRGKAVVLRSLPRTARGTLKQWLLREWKRAGLPLRAANTACGVADAATRKYLDQGHLWYWPPVEMFRRLSEYANRHGLADGRPYFSLDGQRPMTD